MTRIIRWVEPRAKRLRAATEDGGAKGHVRHFEFAIADPSQVRAVPSLLSRIATFFRFSSLDAALLLLILRHARKKTFVSNNTDKTNIVSDNCHKLGFYFLHVPHTFDRVFRRPAELAFSRNGDALSLLATQI